MIASGVIQNDIERLGDIYEDDICSPRAGKYERS